MATSGMTPAGPVPTALTLHQRSRTLEIHFSDAQVFHLPFELLRISSPSAEVRGHGPGQEVLQTGKRGVEVTEVEPVGNYGIRPSFSDGHATGIYTWGFLYELGSRQDEFWRDYAERLAAAGVDRDAPMVADDHQHGSHCSH